MRPLIVIMVLAAGCPRSTNPPDAAVDGGVNADTMVDCGVTETGFSACRLAHADMCNWEHCVCAILPRVNEEDAFCLLPPGVFDWRTCTSERPCAGGLLCSDSGGLVLGTKPYLTAGLCLAEDVCRELHRLDAPRTCLYADGTYMGAGFIPATEACLEDTADIICGPGEGCSPCGEGRSCMGLSEASGIGLCVDDLLLELGACSRETPCGLSEESCLRFLAPVDGPTDPDLTPGTCVTTERCRALADSYSGRLICDP